MRPDRSATALRSNHTIPAIRPNGERSTLTLRLPVPCSTARADLYVDRLDEGCGKMVRDACCEQASRFVSNRRSPDIGVF